MNEVKQVEHEAEISSLLLPLIGHQLLLPAVTVAEMVPYQNHQPADQAVSDWYLGEVLWRHQRIPMVSYERMSGDALPPINDRCHIAILNNTGVNEPLSFLALLTQGIPRLSRVSSEEIHEVADEERKPFDLMPVKHAGELLVIPDVTAMQQAVLDLKVL